ncbi:hypothetical protein FPANT_252 [Fusarium pseudoanthophilum]|uniref:Haloacid dehalogenase-like hydrolase n=1 Tax=Fusarium pseudoanthophilum TaxID=48495 RepID=A0A8H5Q5E4_9HYPO|nr:hypothetical protein FPANT_252 [Fusarium pseudoanthophilum]
MSTNTEAPPQPRPPDELDRDRRGGKAIFFTLDTLFDRDFANERGLEKCKRLCSRLGGKSMDELKRAYHHAMASAYRNHIRAHLPGVVSQASVDKVELMFQELNLDPPSMDDKHLIGSAFAAGFNRNRFEVLGASGTLAQLQTLEYTIVIADDDLTWDTVKDLNFWRYIDAMIITTDMVRPKPDRSVFKNALDACGVAPKNAVIVGCSIEKDIAGILNAQAEPILYMPGYDSMEMDVQGTCVSVVRSMTELLSKIRCRPENRHLATAQRHQLPPPPTPPASQAQGYTNDENGGSSIQHHYQGSSQSQRPASDPKPIYDGHATQSREKVPLSQPRSSDETPRRHSLPGHAHSTKHYERISRPVPTLSCTPAKRPYATRSEDGYVPSSSYREQGYPEHDPTRGYHDPAARPNAGPSTESSSPDTPQLTGQLMGPNGDGSGQTGTGSRQPAARIGISRVLSMTSMNIGLREMGTLHMVDIQLYLQLEVGINHPSQATSPIGEAFGQAIMGMGTRLWQIGPLHKAAMPLEVQARIRPPIPATPSIRVSPSLGILDTSARFRADLTRPKMHSKLAYETHDARPWGGIWESLAGRGYPRREEQRVRPYHGEVVDLTFSTMNAAPSSQAPLSTTQGPAIPGDPSHQPSHGDSNSPPKRWSAPRPQADEQQKARSSSHDEGSTADTGSSPHTLTAQSPSPETAGPDDAAAEPPHKPNGCRRSLRV